MQLFQSTQFLYDYSDDSLLLSRLNQVMKRVTLPSLTGDCLPVLRDARRLLTQHGEELLEAVGSAPEFSLTINKL